MDTYNSNRKVTEVEYSIDEALVSQSCLDNNNNEVLSYFRKNPLIKELEYQLEAKKFTKINNNSKNKIENYKFRINWKNCEFSGSEKSIEEMDEFIESQRLQFFSIMTLGIFPVFIRTRTHIYIEAEVNDYICKSTQPVKIGNISHLFYLPLVFYSLREDTNRNIIRSAISRGIDDILSHIENHNCVFSRKN
ncbi:MAG: hypothetical protein MH321_14915 [Leptospiraceae bacterium]|nr:hypothetical protein [Leptospiraceae bacterium]